MVITPFTAWPRADSGNLERFDVSVETYGRRLVRLRFSTAADRILAQTLDLRAEHLRMGNLFVVMQGGSPGTRLTLQLAALHGVLLDQPTSRGEPLAMSVTRDVVMQKSSVEPEPAIEVARAALSRPVRMLALFDDKRSGQERDAEAIAASTRLHERLVAAAREPRCPSCGTIHG